MKLRGFTIFVRNVESASAYYENLFKISAQRKDKNSCTFIFGEVKYFIHKKDSWEEGMSPNEDHVEFEVEDLDEEIKRLKEQNFKIEIEPKDYYWGKSAYLCDPDGRVIELVQK